jgi:hypothetical protein
MQHVRDVLQWRMYNKYKFLTSKWCVRRIAVQSHVHAGSYHTIDGQHNRADTNIIHIAIVPMVKLISCVGHVYRKPRMMSIRICLMF